MQNSLKKITKWKTFKIKYKLYKTYQKMKMYMKKS